MPNSPLEEAARGLEGRIRDQIKRSQSVDSNTDPRKVIELQIKFEKDRLQQRLTKLEEAEDADEVGEMSLRYLINEFLPQLERKLKTR